MPYWHVQMNMHRFLDSSFPFSRYVIIIIVTTTFLTANILLLKAAADTGQGWVNCILYILLSSEMRRRMFVLPFRRMISTFKFNHDLRTTTRNAQLLEKTQNTSSTRAKARDRGDTYMSFPTEFPRSVQEEVVYASQESLSSNFVHV